MKKLFVIIFVTIICFSLFFILFIRTNRIRPNEMKNLFETYETENYDAVAYIKHEKILLYNEEQINLEDCLPSEAVRIREVLCVFNDRIYMINRDISLEQNHINIASISLEGTDYRIHYTLNLDNSNEFYNKKIFNPINQENNSFSEYRKGQIFICVNKRYYAYNIQEDCFSELNEPWDFYYKSSGNHNDNSLIIVNYKTKLQKELTLKKMAETNGLAKKLSLISAKKIWNNETVSKYFFAENINMVDGEIYLICKPLDFWGQGYAVIFKYNMENDVVIYDSWEYLDDVAMKFYVIATDNR